jgi:ABC-type antimicrobial peptide transport system permease subunit
MYFILGVIIGILIGIIFFLIAYAIMREIIFKHGKPIGRMIEDKLNTFETQTRDTAQIVYPDYSKEVFEHEGSTLNDLIK